MTWSPRFRSSSASHMPRIVNDFMLGRRAQKTDIPILFSANSHFRYIEAPATSCSCARFHPSGTERGESIETMSGLAATVTLTRSQSVTRLLVSACAPCSIAQPVALRSLPVRSMPTIFGSRIALRSRSPATNVSLVAAPAGGRDALGRLQVQCPLDHVGVVAPEVDQITARVIPEIAVSKMRAQRIVRPFRRGSEPEFVIEFGRRRAIGRFPERRVAGGQRTIHAMDLAQGAGADHLHHAPVCRAIVVDVVPHLGDALVP